MLPRRLPQLAALLAACMTVPAACGDDPGDGASETDAGPGGPGTVGPGRCPAAAPEAGEPCLSPEGTTCGFGACGTRLAQCTTGIWRYATNPPPLARCPAKVPGLDDECPPCWPAGVTCPYGIQDCSVKDAAASPAVASCAEGKWRVDVLSCADGGDAGPDVQGDGAQ